MTQPIDYLSMAKKNIDNINKTCPKPGAVFLTQALTPLIDSCPQAVAGIHIAAEIQKANPQKKFTESHAFRFRNWIGHMPDDRKREFASMFISKYENPEIDKTAVWWRDVNFADEMIKYVKTFSDGDVHGVVMPMINLMNAIVFCGWRVSSLETKPMVFDRIVNRHGFGLSREVDHEVLHVEFYHKFADFKTIKICFDYSSLAAQLLAQQLMRD